jgi:hypothetical protein
MRIVRRLSFLITTIVALLQKKEPQTVSNIYCDPVFTSIACMHHEKQPIPCPGAGCSGKHTQGKPESCFGYRTRNRGCITGDHQLSWYTHMT